MPRTRWIKVDATIVECFRAWVEPAEAPHPLFEIVVDIKTPSGQVERVSSQQRLHTLTHRWRLPEPGDVVSASWDRAGRNLRLDLSRGPRYNEKLIKALGRTLMPVLPTPDLLDSAEAQLCVAMRFSP